MIKIALFTILLFSQPELACFQIDGGHVILQNSAIRARYTLDRKPLASAPVQLTNKKNGIRKSARTDGDGLVAFEALAPGEYELTLSEPSYEPLQVSLRPGFPEKTHLSINFFADWCRNVVAVPDVLPWTSSGQVLLPPLLPPLSPL